jgi:hypothetical protein
MHGDRTVYELGNGLEIHVTREGKVLHIIDDHSQDELDITETTLGQLLLKQGGRHFDEPASLSTMRH